MAVVNGALPKTRDGSGPLLEPDGSILQLLQRMRELVEELDPVSKDTDDATLRRFLLARSKNVVKATKMFVDHQNWRRSFVPLGYIPEEDVLAGLQDDKVFLQGHDKKGRPIGVVAAAKHFPGDVEAYKRYTVFCLDKFIASLPPGVDQFCCIVDMKGLGYRNIDVRGWTSAFVFLQDYYPERLGKLFILHAPYIFWGAWKLVAPFIDKATTEKIVFVGNKEMPQALLVDIDEEQLPEVLGGKIALVPIQKQNAPRPNWSPPNLSNQ